MKEYKNLHEFLTDIIKGDIITDKQDKIMEYFLREIGYKSALVITGVVYLEGKGSMSSPPIVIQAVAEKLLNSVPKDMLYYDLSQDKGK